MGKGANTPVAGAKLADGALEANLSAAAGVSTALGARTTSLDELKNKKR